MLSFKFVFAVVLFVSLAGNSYQVDSPVVTTPLGKIQGTLMKTVKNQDIYAYRGIPYAKAPIGELRFKNAEPVTAWTDTFDAKSDGKFCPQNLFYPAIEMSEDCLLLNVYTKKLDGNASVFFYIHGGANIFGSGHSRIQGPQYILDKDIVLVTINYRLGALGFLSTGTAEAPGNNAYKDQVLAMKWVRDNIKAFGGNPNSVTIVGESAGSLAVSLHMASPMSRGLFHRAIAMSASAANRYYTDNVGWTKKLAKAVSCPMFESKALVNCLQTVSWDALINATIPWTYYGLVNREWMYEIEKDFGQERFLASEPSLLISKGDIAKVPLMAGITKNEFEYGVDHLKEIPGMLNDINENFEEYAPELFIYDPKVEEDRHVSKDIKKFYFGDKSISNDTIRDLGFSYSDATLSHGVHQLVELARKHIDVYYYRMDYVGRYGNKLGSDGKPVGCLHGDDLQYIFVMDPVYKLLATTDPEYKMVEHITSWWTSFAQTGVPTSESADKWIASNSTYMKTFYINETSHMGDTPYADRFALWDTLFPLMKSSGAIKASISGLIVVAITLNIFKLF